MAERSLACLAGRGLNGRAESLTISLLRQVLYANGMTVHRIEPVIIIFAGERLSIYWFSYSTSHAGSHSIHDSGLVD